MSDTPGNKRKRARHPGVRKRHTRTCAVRSGKTCNCSGSWEAEVYDAMKGKKVRRSFPTEAAARAWRADMERLLRQGRAVGPSGVSLSAAAEEWLKDASAGIVRSRAGTSYKPATLRSYRQTLDKHVLPALGALPLHQVTHQRLGLFVEDLIRDGLRPGTVRNCLAPLRVIFKREVKRGNVPTNPVSGLDLPRSDTDEIEVVSPLEAAHLLAVLAPLDRAIWSVAMYAGLRAGELQALTWDNVSLADRTIHVAASYDRKAKVVLKPKSKAGGRRVPVTDIVADVLRNQQILTGWSTGLVFGRSPTEPFDYQAVVARAQKTWRDTGLRRLTLHQCRHTFASFMIEAGVNAKALSTYMGHSNVSFTFDTYGHLMPGSQQQVAALLNSYLKGGSA